MSATRPFGYTGAADTCKWCGRKLRRAHYVERGPSDKPPRGQCPHVAGVYGEGERCTSRTYGRDGQLGWRCLNNHYRAAPRVVLSRTPKHAKPGDYGDGHFCGLTCGYLFAVRLANLGSCLLPKVPRT